jgi:hypothetical protein
LPVVVFSKKHLKFWRLEHSAPRLNGAGTAARPSHKRRICVHVGRRPPHPYFMWRWGSGGQRYRRGRDGNCPSISDTNILRMAPDRDGAATGMAALPARGGDNRRRASLSTHRHTSRLSSSAGAARGLTSTRPWGAGWATLAALLLCAPGAASAYVASPALGAACSDGAASATAAARRAVQPPLRPGRIGAAKSVLALPFTLACAARLPRTSGLLGLLLSSPCSVRTLYIVRRLREPL